MGERVGFGIDTTGGAGGSVCEVTRLSDAGTGSLRACVSRAGRQWIVFAVSGAIDLRSPIRVPSNTTLDGRGATIVLRRRGLYLEGSNNVILHNFAMTDGVGDPEEDDAIRLRDARNVWVHRLDLSDYPDGLLDITRASTQVTVSHCEFHDHDKVMLIGHSPTHSADRAIRVTLTRNYFHDSNVRHPRLRYGRVHAFNNVWERWDGYGVAASQESEFLSENNAYLAGADDDAIVDRWGSDPNRGFVSSNGDVFRGEIRAAESRHDRVFRPAYPYAAAPMTDALIETIRREAGSQTIPLPR